MSPLRTSKAGPQFRLYFVKKGWPRHDPALGTGSGVTDALRSTEHVAIRLENQTDAFVILAVVGPHQNVILHSRDAVHADLSSHPECIPAFDLAANLCSPRIALWVLENAQR